MKKYQVTSQEINGQIVDLIEFYDEHTYKIVDKYYPSISKKLGIIDKGYGYHQWERQVGLNADILMNRASESGTKIHNAIESALLGNEIKADDPEYNFTKEEWVKFLAFCEWWNFYGFKVLKLEQIVWDEELGTAGKLDCIAYRDIVLTDKKGEPIKDDNGYVIEDRIIYVFDWKTGGIYDSYHEQVLFYKHCAVKLGLCPEDSIPALVEIGSSHRKFDDKKLQGIKVGVHIVDQDDTMPKLISSITAWDLRNKDWQPPILQYPITVKLNNVLEVRNNK